MSKHFWKNPRPLVYCLCVMTFLCLVLLVLYWFAEKENTLLQSSRSEQFLSLAAGEAEEAVSAYRNNRSVAEVYHRVCSAAEYLSMAAPTEENQQIAADLREAGRVLLDGGILPETAGDSLKALSRCAADCAVGSAVSEPKPEYAAETELLPWGNMPCITRSEGLKIAESITETKNCLTPAIGKYFSYSCRNVYVKLSQHGGIPLEIAVYTPVRREPSYTKETCAFRSSRFLETVLPRHLREREHVSEESYGSIYRYLYPCGNRYIRVDVRTDTGRITGLQMLPA